MDVYKKVGGKSGYMKKNKILLLINFIDCFIYELELRRTVNNISMILLCNLI